jgi:hypothetical protein
MQSPNRREILIDKMNDLESRGMGCLGCTGRCCTFESNSMMLTPIEAVELITYLKEKKHLNSDLLHNLQNTASKFRLESKPLKKQRSYLRKTYTCPFFTHAELGCPLPREIKPYGCLAFDSHHAELKASEHCYSEIDLLEKREALHPEENELNENLREKYNLYWEKSPIPLALLDLWEYFSDADQSK